MLCLLALGHLSLIDPDYVELSRVYCGILLIYFVRIFGGEN